MPRYDMELVRSAAAGRWPECFAKLASVSPDLFDGKHHGCPKCGGDDRFRFIDKDKGAAICNQCFRSNNGDGFAVLQWLAGIDFKEALNRVADFFGIKPLDKPSQSNPEQHLHFLPWNQTAVGLWCLKKKPIKPEAIKKLGGQVARYRDQYTVIAIPVHGINQNEKPVGWVIYRTDGGELPYKFKNGKPTEWVKMKLTYGSKKGLIGSLEGETLWKVEGPSDLLALLSHDLPSGHGAFTTANGATEKPLDWIIKGCEGKAVYVVHDADKPGQTGATYIEQSDGGRRPGWCPLLSESAREVKNVCLPFVVESTRGSDLRDYFNGGATFDDLLARAKEAEPFQVDERAKDYVEEEIDDPHRLARINLKNYEDDHGGRLVFWRDEWWKWKAGKYRRIELGELRAKVTAAIRQEFVRYWQEKNDSDSKVKRVTRGLVTNVIGAMESLATIPWSIEMPSWIPTRESRHLIAMKNGILDLDAVLNGEPLDSCVMEHTHDWFSPVMLEYEFNPNAECPLWLDYLNYTLNGDQERIALLQEWAGYLLTSDNEYQRFLVIEGEGGNGKTVFFAAMRAMLGPENVSSVSIENFGGRFDLGCTLGKAANITGDVGEIESLAEGILKQFTGGDVMMFDRKNKPPISARPTAKLMASWNNRPRIKDRSRGLWRRMLIVPFDREIDANRKVRGMDNHQWWINQGEVAGILMWAIVGLDRLRQSGDFTEPKAMTEAIYEYQLDSNPAMRFLDGCVEMLTGEDMQVELQKPLADQNGIHADELYEKYRKWCSEESIQPVAKQNFGKQVKRQFGDIRHRRGTRGDRYYIYRFLYYSDGDF